MSQMSIINRRNLLCLGLNGAFYSSVAWSDDLMEPLVKSSDFENGAYKGFVIGTVRNRDDAYMQKFVDTGANIGRIFFPFVKCRDCEQFGMPQEYVESLRRILTYARSRRVKLIIVGEFPGVEHPEFWINAVLQKSFIENWRVLSRLLGNDPVVAGLDLLNEPNPPWLDGKLANAQQRWRSLAEATIEAIRSENVALPIVFEGVAGGSSLGLRNFIPLADKQVIYSIHFYTPHDITHQNVNSSFLKEIPYPAGVEWGLGKWDPEIGVGPWNRQRLEIDLRDTISFQRKYGVPIYVGEFSCVRWAPDKSRERYIADCLSIFKKYGWSWTYHEFRGWPGWDAEIPSPVRSDTNRTSNSPTMKLLTNEFFVR